MRDVLGSFDHPEGVQDERVVGQLVTRVGEHRHEMHGRVAFAAWLGVHAELLANTDAELKAFLAWAEEFYLRPHRRSAELLDPATVDTPRIDWSTP